MSATAEEWRTRARAIRWHHPIELAPGVNTRPERHIRRRFDRRIRLLQLPPDMRGLRVLDVGAWDGLFSFECERRGADVLAIDTYAWDVHGQAGFLLAHEALGSRVRHERLSAEQLDARLVGQFDLVLFLGVFYHLRDPLAVLERVRSILRPGGTLVCETHALIPALHGRYPLVTFFPGDGFERGRRYEFTAIPTIEALEQMLLSAGFSTVDVKYRPSFRPLKQLKALVTNRPQSGRLIVHAR